MMDVPPNMRLQPTAQRAAFQIVTRLPRVSRPEGLASTRPGSCAATSYALPAGHGIGRKTAAAIWRAGGGEPFLRNIPLDLDLFLEGGLVSRQGSLR